MSCVMTNLQWITTDVVIYKQQCHLLLDTTYLSSTKSVEARTIPRLLRLLLSKSLFHNQGLCCLKNSGVIRPCFCQSRACPCFSKSSQRYEWTVNAVLLSSTLSVAFLLCCFFTREATSLLQGQTQASRRNKTTGKGLIFLQLFQL